MSAMKSSCEKIIVLLLETAGLNLFQPLKSKTHYVPCYCILTRSVLRLEKRQKCLCFHGTIFTFLVKIKSFSMSKTNVLLAVTSEEDWYASRWQAKGNGSGADLIQFATQRHHSNHPHKAAYHHCVKKHIFCFTNSHISMPRWWIKRYKIHNTTNPH